MEGVFCPWEPARYLIFSSNVPQILYYALVPGMLASVFLGLFVFFNNRKSLSSLLFLLISLCFFVRGVFDLILFATNDPSVVMIYWSYAILAEPLIYAGGLYLAYVFFDKKDISFIKKVIIVLLLSPFVFFLPTKFNLRGVNLSDCTAMEGPIALYFSYAVEIVFILWIIILVRSRYRKVEDKETKKEIILFTLGIVFFLLTFSSGNIIGSFTSDWVVSQYGYFGMPIFIAFLVYLIVRYEAFNIKLFGAQALVFILIALIGSQFFFIQNSTNRILTTITLILVSGSGYFLIQSVKKEVQRKEELQMMADRLAEANQRLKKLDQAKSDFISIASHQLRTPLTSIKGFISLILEGSYGIISGDVQNALNKVYLSNERLIHLVEDLLNISRIESGKLQFRMEECNIGELLSDIREMFVLRAREKGLELSLFIRDEALPTVFTDGQKVREIISNLVDNAIKYSERGEVNIIVERIEDRVRISVKDEGMGIEPEEIGYLFQKFSRGKDIGRVHANGTGLGLYVGKHLIEALGGSIHVFSRGRGQGSVFSIELPLRARGNLSQSTERDVFTSV